MDGMRPGTDGIKPGMNGVDPTDSAARHVARLLEKKTAIRRDFYSGLFTFGQ